MQGSVAVVVVVVALAVFRLTTLSCAVCEPVIVELEPGTRRPEPAGFWRGTRFHGIVRILERRSELGASYLRVLADRGCYDLRRVTAVDPDTWRPEGRWELVAELTAIPLSRRRP
jgi:hypothetical protein